MKTEPMPRDKGFDNALNLLQEGYLFISNRCRRYETDMFQTRFLGIKVICMSGAEAAELFYDNTRFQRKGAIPKRLQKTMIGKHAVQTLDDADHRHRKQLLLMLVNPHRIRQLVKLVQEEWLAAIQKWEKQEKIVLFRELQEVLCRAACRWTGVPLADDEAADVAESFGDLVGALGIVAGPRYREGKRSRLRIDRWLTDLIERVRTEELQPGEETALVQIARHRDLDGNLLDGKIAAVVLNNLLHPVVSISVYLAFGSLALYEHPHCRERMLAGDDTYIEWFVQEVRRFYPFAPFVGAKVRHDFVWRNYAFTKGTRVLLDIYGTNRSPRLWEQPDMFWPERFQNWTGSKFALIPQGGGDTETGHRCAGEQVTMEVLKAGFTILIHKMTYDICKQDFGYSLARMSTVPRDGIVMSNVRRK